MRRARPLTEDDKAAWALYVNGPAAARATPTPPAPPPPPRPTAPRRRAEPGPLECGRAPAGLDRGTWQRFRTGVLAPERRLDLHGRTLAAAHGALLAFLHAAHADQVRCVEVITGKGSGTGGGAIRRELPLWLNDPGLRRLLLAATHPHAANPGATILLLRRKRSRPAG